MLLVRWNIPYPKPIIERFVKYAEYVEKCPKGGITWESGFGYFCKHGCADEECGSCSLGPSDIKK